MTTCTAREVATGARKLLGLQPSEAPPPTDEARGEGDPPGYRYVKRAPSQYLALVDEFSVR